MENSKSNKAAAVERSRGRPLTHKRRSRTPPACNTLTKTLRIVLTLSRHELYEGGVMELYDQPRRAFKSQYRLEVGTSASVLPV